MKNKTIVTFLILMSFLLAACSGAAVEPTEDTAPPTDVPPTEAPPTEAAPEPIELTDGAGVTVTLEEPAQRVVSLAPSNTEILFAIGAGDQVVGRDSFSDYPEAALEIPDIGGGFGELDTETILAADPDLVIAAGITPPEQVQALTDLGLTVFTLENPTDFAGMFENLRTVALLTGHEADAEAVIADLEARLAAVKEKVAGVSDPVLVFYELDGTDPNAPWTAGPGTFVDTLITQAGGINIGAEMEGAWAQISIEQLIDRDPAIILLGDYIWGGVTPEDVAARGGWEALTAVQNGEVHPFDDNLVSRPGPRLIDGLEEMAALLHPELFE